MSLFSMMGLGDMDEDPIFGTMHHMDNMFNSMFNDPFGMMGARGLMGPTHAGQIAHTGHANHRSRGGEHMGLAASPFRGMFGFPNINRLFDNMTHMTNDPNCHSFSSSTVMTMTNGPDGTPQVYQASQSTRSAPGGIRETKKTVCDSRSGTKKMAIGHHIGERAHIVEREQNVFTGEQEQREDLINLDEEEAPQFNREWEQKTGSVGVAAVTNGRRHHQDLLALPSTTSVAPSTTSNLRAKARAAVRARRSQLALSSPRVEITEVTDDEDNANATTETAERSASPIIEYPSTSHHRREVRDRDRHSVRAHIREHHDREGSRKRYHEEDYEERRRHHKSRKPY